MYAYKTIEEYEGYSGYTVNQAFRIGWEMARLTNEMLGIKEEPLKAIDFITVLRESQLFNEHQIDNIAVDCKTNTLGQVLSACRKQDIGLDDEAVTTLARMFINA